MSKSTPVASTKRHKFLLDRVSMYAVTATAASVGILAVSETAEASVVFTPAHTQITVGTMTLDLNNDGIPDFNLIRNSFFTSERGGNSSTFIAPVNPSNRIEGNGRTQFVRSDFVSASALPAGSLVGPGKPFFPAGQKFMRGYFIEIYGLVPRSSGGAWATRGHDISDRYLGLAFTINGETHFGWARISVPPLNHQFDVGTTLTGYAYETVANTAITTGPQQSGLSVGSLRRQQPRTPASANTQTLGALALGYNGIAVWRRREGSSGQSESAALLDPASA